MRLRTLVRNAGVDRDSVEIVSSDSESHSNDTKLASESRKKDSLATK